jgi:hypothetical protein
VNGDDPRLIRARDALAAAVHPVDHLPPSVMARELAELRQVVTGLVDLVDEHREILGQALADAVTLREPASECDDCRLAAGLWCHRHEADMEAVGAYGELGRAFGLDVPLPEAPTPQDEAAQLAAVRAVLDGFDWARDDRQYALEQIERIVTGGDR